MFYILREILGYLWRSPRERSFVPTSGPIIFVLCMISHILFVLFGYVGPFTIPFWNSNAKDPLFYFHTFLTQFEGFFSSDWLRKIKGNYLFWSFVNKKVYKLSMKLKRATSGNKKPPSHASLREIWYFRVFEGAPIIPKVLYSKNIWYCSKTRQ